METFLAICTVLRQRKAYSATNVEYWLIQAQRHSSIGANFRGEDKRRMKIRETRRRMNTRMFNL